MERDWTPTERQAHNVLVVHQRRDIGSCLCGWGDLGQSYVKHVIDELRRAGLALTEMSDIDDAERMDPSNFPILNAKIEDLF